MTLWHLLQRLQARMQLPGGCHRLGQAAMCNKGVEPRPAFSWAGDGQIGSSSSPCCQLHCSTDTRHSLARAHCSHAAAAGLPVGAGSLGGGDFARSQHTLGALRQRQPSHESLQRGQQLLVVARVQLQLVVAVLNGCNARPGRAAWVGCKAAHSKRERR